MFNEFIKEIIEKEIKISFSNGKLQYSGPEQYINEELIIKLKKYRAKLLKYFWPADCPNIMPINTEGNKVPLILLHAGEANYSLSNYLGSEQPFYGFFYIGSEGEKIRYRSVEAFAEEYLNQLMKIVPQGPYYLGGFSFGGILAYEMAVILGKKGFDVPLLILVDCEIKSPENENDKSQHSHYRRSALKKYLRGIYNWIYFNSIKNIDYFLQLLKINIPVKYRNSYIIWTYSRLLGDYKPITPFSGKILLFKVEENQSQSQYLGWDRLCDQIQMEILKGNHRTMYRSQESIDLLSEKIDGAIKNAGNKD